MSEQFKVGDVVIWRNQVGECAFLNGRETTIVSELQWHDIAQGPFFGYETDTITDETECEFVVWYGEPREFVRRKPPTTGEQSIMSLFLTTPQREGAPA